MNAAAKPVDDWEPSPIVNPNSPNRMSISVVCPVCNRYYRPRNRQQRFCTIGCAGRAKSLAATYRNAERLRLYDERKAARAAAAAREADPLELE